MDNLRLRLAKAEDSEFAYLVRRAAYRDYSELLKPWNEEEERQLHQERFGRQTFQIVMMGQHCVGVVVYAAFEDQLALHQLFLLPEFQSKGIGEGCMERIIQEANSLGVPIHLRVAKVNPRGKAFYTRFGFVTYKESETHDLMERKPDPK